MRSKKDPKFTRAILLQLLAPPFAARGGRIEAILRRNRIPREALSDPDWLIEASAYYAAIEDMAASIGDPYFGARVAQDVARQGTPTLRESADRASTLGDFLISAVIETARQFDNVVYSLRVGSDAAVFEIRRTRHIDRPTIQVDAIGVAFYVSIVKACVGTAFDPTRVLAVAPSHDGLPPDVLPAHSLGRSADVGLSLTLPSEWLQAPFGPRWTQPRRPSVAHMAAPVPLAFLREAMRERLIAGDIDLGHLAEACGTTPRRLQRLFARHGTSFREFRDEIRRDLAIELVTRTRMPLKEIAVLSGFSGESAFGRSYRRWTGMSPGAGRRGG